MRVNRSMVLRAAVAVFVVAALGFFAYALVDAWNATNGEIPSVPRLLLAGGVWAVGLLAGAFAWAELLGGPKLEHGAALLVSQLGKYVPGGVVQATGQLGLARSAGVSVKRAATTLSVLAVTQAIAGCTWVIVLAAVWSDARVGLRVLLAVGGFTTLLFIDRRWMVWVLHKIPRTRDAAHELIPSQRSILLAYAANFVAVSAAAGAYAIVLGSFENSASPLLVMSAFATAWTVGFIAIPIPSGVGIREAVLVGILHGVLPSSVIVATSVYQRLVSVATEGLIALAVSHRLRPSRLAAARASSSDVAAAPPDEDTDDA